MILSPSDSPELARCLVLDLTAVVAPVDDRPAGLRLSRDTAGTDPVLTHLEARRAAEQARRAAEQARRAAEQSRRAEEQARRDAEAKLRDAEARIAELETLTKG